MSQEVDFERLRTAALGGARAGGVDDRAEDVAHESILSFLTLKHHVALPETYVFQKAVWLAIDLERARASRRRREVAWARMQPTSAVSDPTVALHLQTLLPAHLLLVARMLEAGFSFSEIADSLCMTKAAVQRRVESIRRLVAA